MKVVLVTPYWSPVRGGATRYVQGLSVELRRADGFDVSVIAREGNSEAGVSVVGGTPTQFVRRAAEELHLQDLEPRVIEGHRLHLRLGV